MIKIENIYYIPGKGITLVFKPLDSNPFKLNQKVNITDNESFNQQVTVSGIEGYRTLMDPIGDFKVGAIVIKEDLRDIKKGLFINV